MCKCAVKEGYVNNNGVELYYRMQGLDPSKPLIVFLHGIPSNSTVWGCQQNYFCHCFRTLAMDFRGSGKSSKVGPYTAQTLTDDLYFLLSSLNLLNMPFYLVGWSYGGNVAQVYALTYPQTLAKLVLVDTSPQLASSPDYPYGLSPEKAQLILGTLATNFPAFIALFSNLIISEKCPGAEIPRSQVAKAIAETGQEVSLQQFSDSALSSTVGQLQNILAPTFIMVGLQDQILGPKPSIYMNLNIPNSQMYQFPDAGHAPFLTYKDTFNRELCYFLTGKIFPCQICKCYPN